MSDKDLKELYSEVDKQRVLAIVSKAIDVFIQASKDEADMGIDFGLGPIDQQEQVLESFFSQIENYFDMGLFGGPNKYREIIEDAVEKMER